MDERSVTVAAWRCGEEAESACGEGAESAGAGDTPMDAGTETSGALAGTGEKTETAVADVTPAALEVAAPGVMAVAAVGLT